MIWLLIYFDYRKRILWQPEWSSDISQWIHKIRFLIWMTLDALELVWMPFSGAEHPGANSQAWFLDLQQNPDPVVLMLGDITISHPLQPLGHPQLLQKKDHESQKDEDPAGQSCPQPASFSSAKCLRGTRGGPSFGGGLGVYVCECHFWGLVIWIAKSSHLAATQNCSIHWLHACCYWCLYHLYHLLVGSHAYSLLL